MGKVIEITDYIKLNQENLIKDDESDDLFEIEIYDDVEIKIKKSNGNIERH